jgi:hypothetical protein
MSTQKKTAYKVLSEVDVTKKLEKKGRFDYLSWAYAWAIVKDKYPNANRKVYESETTELNYFTDGKTGYVKVGFCLEGYDNTKEKNALGLEHVDYLPIKNNLNQSIPLGNITSFSVNTSIQRSTAKAIGMHGLGLSLWVGEDLKDIGDDLDDGLKLKAPTVSKKKAKAKPTGDFAKDIIKVKEALAKGSKWEDAERWLKSSDHYDAVALAEFKGQVDA